MSTGSCLSESSSDEELSEICEYDRRRRFALQMQRRVTKISGTGESLRTNRLTARLGPRVPFDTRPAVIDPMAKASPSLQPSKQFVCASSISMSASKTRTPESAKNLFAELTLSTPASSTPIKKSEGSTPGSLESSARSAFTQFSPRCTNSLQSIKRDMRYISVDFGSRRGPGLLSAFKESLETERAENISRQKNSDEDIGDSKLHENTCSNGHNEVYVPLTSDEGCIVGKTVVTPNDECNKDDDLSSIGSSSEEEKFFLAAPRIASRNKALSGLAPPKKRMVPVSDGKGSAVASRVTGFPINPLVQNTGGTASRGQSPEELGGCSITLDPCSASSVSAPVKEKYEDMVLGRPNCFLENTSFVSSRTTLVPAKEDPMHAGPRRATESTRTLPSCTTPAPVIENPVLVGPPSLPPPPQPLPFASVKSCQNQGSTNIQSFLKLRHMLTKDQPFFSLDKQRRELKKRKRDAISSSETNVTL